MKIVLTAAIMDLCHRGHINLLKRMREAGDYVVVVLHDDKSCYQIKGKFPIQDLTHRMNNVRDTGLADDVFSTDSTDPALNFEAVIQAHPEDEVVFMRGDDNMEFPGRWLIDQYNIPIEFVPYTKDISSTMLRNDLLKEDNETTLT